MPHKHDEEDKSRRWTVYLLAGCAAIDAADMAMVPGMFRAFQNEFGVSLEQLGFMYFVSTIISGLALPLWGHLGDTFSRKSLTVLGCFCWGLCTLGCAAARSFQEFMIFRVVAILFLAQIMPITQSVASSLADSAERGKIFGQIGFCAAIGGICGRALSTSTAEEMYWGIQGWRVLLAFTAAVSVGYACVVAIGMREPKKVNAVKGFYREAFQFKSFWILVLQGIFGCIPWRAFGIYGLLWMQIIGFSPLQVTILVTTGGICGAIATYFSGFLSDWAHSKTAYHGRVYVAQTSKILGMVTMTTLLVILPKSTDAVGFALFLATSCAFHLTAGWTTNGINRPLISDIVPEGSRASIFSYFHMIEMMPSSLAGYLVSYLAEEQFGYTKPDVAALSDAEQAANVAALSKALFAIMMVPWVVTFIVYSSLHLTYARDAKRVWEQSLMYTAEKGHHNPKGAGSEEDGLVKVKLLGSGRRL
uniref:Major facilitator superfamily (MFS) profile domain-containing protein n=1 Tax=Lotharella globosa TaxID=91324 RepID=A0A7S3Z0R1_9EUKA|mmetsp:Transcript_7841/g.14522  ORF Transcript_7841/g.14522 Transcript_7841/m.14522 type:complete len:475 (-) Transcript_7841:5-1429(-)|eukprot:CAMPEP_0167807620 /NCGR_PEP_ID=MMETSP0111_2-20121227/22659_1 /TAXON_ID=91324 /ORGANISM="Lotharella globosa, Strain CCCM811" /LENGTH=474 /DNA_ID=CAMNT_0007705553 /DNA_START=41 /DNA_END=1465 /DNA_ORIENTATION=+